MSKLQDFLNSPITAVVAMRKAPKAGDLFGIELECEGRNVGYDGAELLLLNDWAPHHDGSLRDNHGSSCEWVFNGPVKYNKSVDRVNQLFTYFEKVKAKLVTSNRTSTHVHYNMGDKNVYQLVNLFILFTILEDIFDNYCGEDRRGNLFCLSSRHAEQQIRWVMDACFVNNTFNFREDWRYCSLNLASIAKFGTVEFRGMRGLDNKADLLSWLSIVNQFCEYACYTMKNPVELLEKISRNGPRGLLQEIFTSDNVKLLTAGVPEETLNASIYEGLRLVQMLCYKIGTEFDQVRLRGRDFWASFKDDAEPDLDVDPAVAAQNAAMGRPARRGAAGVRLDHLIAQQAQQMQERAQQMQERAQLAQHREAARVQAQQAQMAPNEIPLNANPFDDPFRVQIDAAGLWNRAVAQQPAPQPDPRFEAVEWNDIGRVEIKPKRKVVRDEF